MINQIRKILLLAANPKGSSQLRLDEEVREIKEGLKRSKHRDQYSIATAEAVRYRDIHRAILEHEPQIIHFSGHGSPEDGLVFEDESGQIKLVNAQALAGLFQLFAEQVQCVVLNACYSQYQAVEIACHIDYVVGMSQKIGDRAAIEFTVGFYDALGADKGYEFAYKLGCSSILIAGIAENLTPQLIVKKAHTEKTSKNPTVKTLLPVELEYPDGYVPLSSPFYVEQDGIESVYETLLKPASLIRIKAPKLMGKTSLMTRIIAYGAKHNYQSVYLDFGGTDKAVLINLDRFLRWLCGRVSDELNLENKVLEAWNTNILGSNDNCTAYFKKYILAKINNPLILGLDEVDRLFTYSEVVEDFFGMLRSWHEKSKISDIWKKLRLVLAHSTEVYIPLDVHQSPFNAGLPVELEELSQQQTKELVKKHGIQNVDNVLKELSMMVGGHPYLLRLAMYEIATGKVTLSNLLQSATTEAGIYNSHLRSLLGVLQKAPELQTCLKRVVNSTSGVELDPIQIYKLHSLGLVQKRNNHVTPRCQLYREYFCRVL